MILSYTGINDGRKTIRAKITTDHPMSSYGNPVIVLPDGSLLGVQDWILLNYRIEKFTKKDSALVEKWLNLIKFYSRIISI